MGIRPVSIPWKSGLQSEPSSPATAVCSLPNPVSIPWKSGLQSEHVRDVSEVCGSRPWFQSPGSRGFSLNIKTVPLGSAVMMEVSIPWKSGLQSELAERVARRLYRESTGFNPLEVGASV